MVKRIGLQAKIKMNAKFGKGYFPFHFSLQRLSLTAYIPALKSKPNRQANIAPCSGIDIKLGRCFITEFICIKDLQELLSLAP